MNYKEIELDGEKVYIRKTKFFGWTVIKPAKIDGRIIWKNLISGGDWKKLIYSVIFVILMIGAIFEYSNAVNIANDCLLNNTKVIISNTGLVFP